MTLNLDFNLNEQKTKINLSFLVYFRKTNWYLNGVKQEKNFLSERFKVHLPVNTVFNISSIVFKIESQKEEVLSNYQCFYQESTDSLCFLIDENAKYVFFSKEIMMKLMDFANKIGISKIFLLIARKNKEYVQILQGMMTIGFDNEEEVKTTKINGIMYKVLKMVLKLEPEEIQEIDF